MLLIKEGIIHNMCNESPIRADILIKEKQIIEIGPNLSCNDKSDQTINAKGLHVYPGFIDAHSHVVSRRIKPVRMGMTIMNPLIQSHQPCGLLMPLILWTAPFITPFQPE